MKKGQLLSNAIALATKAHEGQFDKGGLPYILHPLTVMHYLKTDDEELQVIAILHDIIEDTSTTWNDLYAAGCTDRVINAVKALTKQKGQSYEEYKTAVFTNIDAMKVKLCDLRHNTDIRRLKGVSEKDAERMTRYHKFAYEIREKLA